MVYSQNVAIKLPKIRPADGFSLIEMLIVFVVIATLAVIFIGTMAGSRAKDDLDRGTQQVYEDLLLIRSRSVSTNAEHRLNFASTTQWTVESYNSTSLVWTPVGGVRKMPGQTNLTTSSQANAVANLKATPRGIFTFLNNASGSPYVTVSAFGTSTTKSIYVYVGGAIEIQTP